MKPRTSAAPAEQRILHAADSAEELCTGGIRLSEVVQLLFSASTWEPMANSWHQDNRADSSRLSTGLSHFSSPRPPTTAGDSVSCRATAALSGPENQCVNVLPVKKRRRTVDMETRSYCKSACEVSLPFAIFRRTQYRETGLMLNSARICLVSFRVDGFSLQATSAVIDGVQLGQQPDGYLSGTARSCPIG